MEFWSALIVPLSVAVGLVFVPGIAVLASAGLRGTAAVMAAPPISIALIAVSAILFGPTGLDWSVWMPLGLTVLVCIAAMMAGEALRRRRARTTGRHARDLPESIVPAPENRWGGSTSIANYAGLAVTAVLWLGLLRRILDKPHGISQTIDNIFHLSAVRFIQDTGDASSFWLGTLTSAPGTTTLYPSAWHGLVTLVVDLAGTSIPIGTNAATYATYLAWTAGCLFLLHCLLRASPAVVLATGVLSVSFASFPVLLTEFGVLYPNLLGLALAPAAIGLGIQVLGSPTTVRRLSPVTALGLLVASFVGIGFAHPNAVLFVLLVAVPALLLTAVRWTLAAIGRGTGRRIAVAHVAAVVLVLALLPALWSVSARDIMWEPLYTQLEALWRALTNAGPNHRPAWFVSVLVILGIFRSFRTRRLMWLPLGWGVLVHTWIMTAGSPSSPWREFLTSVFYADPYRAGAALPLMAVPLAVLGVLWVEETLHRRIPWGRATRAAAIAWPLVVTLLLTGIAHRSPAMDYAVDRANDRFDYQEILEYTGHQSLLSTDELALIEKLASIVPDHAVVAVNPWNGSSLAYPLAGVSVTENHAMGYRSPEQTLIGERLDEAGNDPEICSVLVSSDVEYVLDFGALIDDLHHTYEGFDSLERAEGFELVAEVGDESLYRITACD